jgi:hypothetical protein
MVSRKSPVPKGVKPKLKTKSKRVIKNQISSSSDTTTQPSSNLKTRPQTTPKTKEQFTEREMHAILRGRNTTCECCKFPYIRDRIPSYGNGYDKDDDDDNDDDDGYDPINPWSCLFGYGDDFDL